MREPSILEEILTFPMLSYFIVVWAFIPTAPEKLFWPKSLRDSGLHFTNGFLVFDHLTVSDLLTSPLKKSLSDFLDTEYICK